MNLPFYNIKLNSKQQGQLFKGIPISYKPRKKRNSSSRSTLKFRSAIGINIGKIGGDGDRMLGELKEDDEFSQRSSGSNISRVDSAVTLRQSMKALPKADDREKQKDDEFAKEFYKKEKANKLRSNTMHLNR